MAFRQQKELETSASTHGDLMQIHYRDEEAIYIRASPDRVTVIFSTVFREETDRILGKVFLQVSWLGWLQRKNSSDLGTRNSLMLDVNLAFRTHPKSSIRIVIHPSKSGMYLVSAILKTLDTSPLCSFPATLPSPIYHTTLFRTFSCSGTTFTTTSSVRKPTCTHGCVTVLQNSKRSSTVPRQR